MIEQGTGNLLAAQVDALVNTVNTEGVMGKGLALQFKKAFPDNFAAYERACKAGQVRVGSMFVVETGTLWPRLIINFPTKKHWRSPSRLEFIEAGLVDLVTQVRARGVRSIAVPPLGCGNGGLDWSDVKPLIERALGDLDDLRVLLFEPSGATREAAIDRTSRPEMTAGRAALIAAMSRYRVPGYDYRLSLLEAQKLAYFLHASGDLPRLTFKAHHYGPYADSLRHVFVRLEGHYTKGYGDGKVKPQTPIELLPGAEEAAAAFLEAQPATRERLNRVTKLIDGFETPFGMELLATVHWVASRAAAAADLDAVVAAVHGWSSRKARTMKPGQIEAAWQRLRDEGWLPRA
jgi:O-acetyl-ADP-ribose deacetylase (regulator of RNase III)